MSTQLGAETTGIATDELTVVQFHRPMTCPNPESNVNVMDDMTPKRTKFLQDQVMQLRAEIASLERQVLLCTCSRFPPL